MGKKGVLLFLEVVTTKLLSGRRGAVEPHGDTLRVFFCVDGFRSLAPVLCCSWMTTVLLSQWFVCLTSRSFYLSGVRTDGNEKVSPTWLCFGFFFFPFSCVFLQYDFHTGPILKESLGTGDLRDEEKNKIILTGPAQDVRWLMNAQPSQQSRLTPSL